MVEFQLQIFLVETDCPNQSHSNHILGGQIWRLGRYIHPVSWIFWFCLGAAWPSPLSDVISCGILGCRQTMWLLLVSLSSDKGGGHAVLKWNVWMQSRWGPNSRYTAGASLSASGPDPFKSGFHSEFCITTVLITLGKNLHYKLKKRSVSLLIFQGLLNPSGPPMAWWHYLVTSFVL